MSDQPKYDVAISFLQEDEALAKKLSDVLSERLEVFVYFDRQTDIAGTDGERTFNQTYASDTRVVVVLYREGWGLTPWTRIEETAIRNRGYENGYDFLTVIPMEQPPTVPKWVPKNRLWIGLDRWGIDGAAAAIEARVQESGGLPRVRSAAEQAAILEKHKKDDDARTAKLNSEYGVAKINGEVESLFTLIKEQAQSISAANTDIKMAATRVSARHLNLHSWGYHVYLSWEYAYANSLREAMMTVQLVRLERLPPFGEHRGEPQILREEAFRPDLKLPETYGWSSKAGPARFYTTAEFAEYCVKLLLELLKKHHPWNPVREQDPAD